MTGRRELRNIVDGKQVPSRSGTTSDVIDPKTGEVYATAPLSAAEDVDAAYRAAQHAFDEVWRSTTPSERMNYLLRIADTIEQHADELVAIETQNTGKPVGLTLSEEIPPMVDQIRFFAGAARVLEGRATGEYMRDYTSSIRREPIGVVGQVAPWNYPMMMAVWKFAPALAAGNCVVLKPSDTTPASAVRMGELMSEILPPGVINVICGDRDTGAAMTSHPIPQLVSITGSVAAGIAVAKSAAEDVKRAHLELGGKAPVIVFDDADIGVAAEGIATGGFFNAGQDCTAATRVLASSRIQGDLVDALVEQAGQIKLSSQEQADDAFYMPPINNSRQLTSVSGFLDRLPDHARVRTGGERVGDRGYFYAPTIVSDLLPEDEMVRNEIFGPVITVQTFSDEDEALRWANGTQYGLASSVWTSNHKRAMRMSRQLDFGCVWINCHIPLVAEMPHGGFKHSGYGKDLSMYGFEDYTRIKHVMSYIGD